MPWLSCFVGFSLLRVLVANQEGPLVLHTYAIQSWNFKKMVPISLQPSSVLILGFVYLYSVFLSIQSHMLTSDTYFLLPM